tara:strand:- start:1196 stop:1594 length:399 start_codon:yes stop_codon:yes gene_type:complete
MKRLLFIPLLLVHIPSAKAGIYIYPYFNKGMEVRCADNNPKHLISLKAGRVMNFKDSGEDKYKWPRTYLFPEPNLYPAEKNKDYSYFPSTVGTRCSYRTLTIKEKKYYIKKAKDTCIKGDLKTREKFCFGWN